MAHEAGKNGTPLEKDFSNHAHLEDGIEADDALKRIRTAGSISISPELFEKIYLSPQNNVKGDLRKTFGNPTPVAIIGFLLALTPLSCDLMNWRGAQTGDGSASIPEYIFFGGVLLITGGLGEFIVGNTFPMVVFFSFGAFWVAFGATLQPFYGAYTNYDQYSATPDVVGSGITTPEFNNAFGFFLLAMGFLCVIYMICALRTNLIFVLIFFTLVMAFGFLTAAFWYGAEGNASRSATYITTGGAFAFVTAVCGWYLFFAILLASLDFPFQLPVGDLSRFIKGASEKGRKEV